MSSRQNSSSTARGADPSAATGGPLIRRAVALRSGGTDPGGLLPTPAAPPSANETRGEEEAAASTAVLPQQPEPEAEAEAPEGTSGRSEAARTASAEGEGAAAPGAVAAGRGGEGAAAPDAAAAGQAGGASGDATARGEGDPPSGAPKKPLLAAAGIAGVVLLAVPLLIWATDDSGQKNDKASVTGNAAPVIADESMNAPPGDYAAATPTPTPKAAKSSASPSAKPSTAQASPKAPAKVAQSLPSPPTPPSSGGTKSDTEKAATTRTVKKTATKPAAGTAAFAVQELAEKSPGRHVCYRALVVGVGWQKAACDGDTAGTLGEGRAIRSLNIAVSAAEGVSANGWLQGDGWKTAWTSAADGANITIGSTSSSAPNLGGFAILVNSGSICQTAHVHDVGWQSKRCGSAAPHYTFGGSTEKQRWLEAVQFTV
ncbi:hypothetical protein ACIREO_33460 [Streptomyces sp. NPDC102441]|uniref:hypothetical protein n=1 Tax=Streptomyces sp. NPDC102441 TaxID=3366176 RepID=UPI003809B964